MTQGQTTRRRFIQTVSAFAAAAPALQPVGAEPSGPANRLGVGLIGCGSKGNTQLAKVAECHKMRNLVKEGFNGHPIHAEREYSRVGDWGERGMPEDPGTTGCSRFSCFRRVTLSSSWDDL